MTYNTEKEIQAKAKTTPTVIETNYEVNMNIQKIPRRPEAFGFIKGLSVRMRCPTLPEIKRILTQIAATDDRPQDERITKAEIRDYLVHCGADYILGKSRVNIRQSKPDTIVRKEYDFKHNALRNDCPITFYGDEFRDIIISADEIANAYYVDVSKCLADPHFIEKMEKANNRGKDCRYWIARNVTPKGYWMTADASILFAQFIDAKGLKFAEWLEARLADFKIYKRTFLVTATKVILVPIDTHDKLKRMQARDKKKVTKKDCYMGALIVGIREKLGIDISRKRKE